MAKKKQSKKSTAKPASSQFVGTLADQLKQALPVEPQAKPAASPLKPSHAAKTPSKASAAVSASSPSTPSVAVDELPERLSDEQLFEHALDQINPQKIFQGKFVGQGVELPKPAPSPSGPAQAAAKAAAKAEALAEAEAASQDEAELREEVQFVRALGYIDPLGQRDKYHKPKAGTHVSRFDQLRDRGYTTEYPDGLLTPQLPKEGPGLHLVELDLAQKGLINRFKLHTRQDACATLNLHGEVLEDALRQLELFVHQEHKSGASYVRLVHGKGLNSEEGKPVLKPAVLQWLEGPGLRYIRGYAPEVGADGNYGSLVVALDTRTAKRPHTK